MIAEGRITFDLGRDGAVRLCATRRPDVGRFLAGRRADEALGLWPLVFSLCGQAHTAAGRQAMGLGSGDEYRRDAVVVLAENAREHLLRILRGWRGGAVDAALAGPDIMALTPRMQAAAGDRMAEEREAAHLARFLQRQVLGVTPERFLALATLADFRRWLAGAQTPAARYLAAICDRGWQGLGAVCGRYLPQLPRERLIARLAEPGFAAAPDWRGRPCETGPLARRHGAPLVAAIIGAYGAALLARLVARLVDLAQIPAQIRDPGLPGPGVAGLGVVETARGRLIHAVQLDRGRVAAYRILAPTEWNFHPRGAAVQALGALPATGDRNGGARALIEAIDPCVDYDLRAA